MQHARAVLIVAFPARFYQGLSVFEIIFSDAQISDYFTTYLLEHGFLFFLLLCFAIDALSHLLHGLVLLLFYKAVQLHRCPAKLGILEHHLGTITYSDRVD